jgi:hypothetical protein
MVAKREIREILVQEQISHNAHGEERMTKKKSKRKEASKVSFARDIRPLFRSVDISHMKAHGIKLDDHAFMSNPENAKKVLGTVSPHDGGPPSMPPGGPFWTVDQLVLFTQWQKDGYQP